MAAGQVDRREHPLLELGAETNFFTAVVLGSGMKSEIPNMERVLSSLQPSSCHAYSLPSEGQSSPGPATSLPLSSTQK